MGSNWGSLAASLLLSFLSITFISASVCYAEDYWVDYQGTGFSLRIPASLSVEKTAPAEDFDLFHLYSEDGMMILGIYAGNHPKFPDDVPEGVALRESTLGGKPLQYAEWKNREGLYGEFLILLHPGGEPDSPIPVYNHFWYLKLNPGKRGVAKKIIDTYQPGDH